MGIISEKEFEAQMREIQIINESKERERKLKEEKMKYKRKIKLPSTSKLVLLGVFLICLEILIFSEYAMLVLYDASAMYALIGIPAALVPTIIGYYSKAKAENLNKYSGSHNNSNIEDSSGGDSEDNSEEALG